VSWLRHTAAGWHIDCHVTPRASRTELAGLHGNRLRIRLQAPPVDGKANKALLTFLADCLNAPRGALSLASGDTGRDKTVRVDGMEESHIRRRLTPDAMQMPPVRTGQPEARQQRGR
jgi:uncharacterized protein (TIGR00251 family)